jgi:hypothetical protein
MFLDDAPDNGEINEEPSEGGIQSPSDYQGLREKCASKHVSGCSIVVKIKISALPYVKVKHHLQMSLTLSRHASNLIV